MQIDAKQEKSLPYILVRSPYQHLKTTSIDQSVVQLRELNNWSNKTLYYRQIGEKCLN